MSEIKEQLNYREANQQKVAAFQTTRTLGENTKVLLDENAGLFLVTSARNLAEANPDVLAFSDVTGCQLGIDETKTEIEYKDAEGNRHSFQPERYACSYNFYIVINVNNPYFSEIRFRLNSSEIDNDEKTLLDGPNAAPARGNVRPGMTGRPGAVGGPAGRMGGGYPTSNAEEVQASMEYRKYETMGKEIRDALLEGRQQARNQSAAPAAAQQEAPKSDTPNGTVTCPYCGATTTPDANGCCEFCGGSVKG